MDVRQRLNFMNAYKATEVGYFTATQLQDFPADQQIAGVALFLHEVCQQVGLQPAVVLNQAARMAGDADTFYRREIKALRDYIKGELK